MSNPQANCLLSLVALLIAIGFTAVVAGNLVAFLMGVWECFDSWIKRGMAVTPPTQLAILAGILLTAAVLVLWTIVGE